jgi:hypothetical protein
MDDIIMLALREDAYGANGDLDRDERINRHAERIVDWVFEALAEQGCCDDSFYGGSLGVVIPHAAYGPIQRLVAAAMITQFEYDRHA